MVCRGPRGEKIYPQQKGPYKRRAAEEGDATVEEIKGVRVSTWLEGRVEEGDRGDGDDHREHEHDHGGYAQQLADARRRRRDGRVGEAG